MFSAFKGQAGAKTDNYESKPYFMQTRPADSAAQPAMQLSPQYDCLSSAAKCCKTETSVMLTGGGGWGVGGTTKKTNTALSAGPARTVLFCNSCTCAFTEEMFWSESNGL